MTQRKSNRLSPCI